MARRALKPWLARARSRWKRSAWQTTRSSSSPRRSICSRKAGRRGSPGLLASPGGWRGHRRKGASAPEVRAGEVAVAALHDLPAVVAVRELGLDVDAPGLAPLAGAQAREGGVARQRGVLAGHSDL